MSESLPVHALHLSTFEIFETNDNATAKLRLRVFQDDLRDAIKYANADLNVVSNEAFLDNRSAEIERYFQQHFQLVFDGKSSPISLTDSQAENDVYWLHFDLVFPEKWETCTLQADYLMELFDDQSNIGTVILNNEKQFFRFIKGDAIFEIVLIR